MIKKMVELRVGELTNQVWTKTCSIADVTLKARQNNGLVSSLQYVLILCAGIADAIKKGYIQEGVA